MGSSGMKRKGRTHLPKVGTPAANEHELEARRAEALHPFSGDPSRRRGPGYTILAVIVGIVVVIGIVAIIVAT